MTAIDKWTVPHTCIPFLDNSVLHNQVGFQEARVARVFGWQFADVDIFLGSPFLVRLRKVSSLDPSDSAFIQVPVHPS